MHDCVNTCFPNRVTDGVQVDRCSILQGVGDYIAYNDCCNDFVMGYRNSVWARQAWHQRRFQSAESVA